LKLIFKTDDFVLYVSILMEAKTYKKNRE